MLMPSTVSTAKFAQNGELFAKLRLNSDLSEDTSHGRLILQNINTVYVAPYNPLKQEESPGKVSGQRYIKCNIMDLLVLDCGIALVLSSNGWNRQACVEIIFAKKTVVFIIFALMCITLLNKQIVGKICR